LLPRAKGAPRTSPQYGDDSMASDIEIAQQATMQRITQVAAKVGVPEE
jgi:hypothetical protein